MHIRLHFADFSVFDSELRVYYEGKLNNEKIESGYQMMPHEWISLEGICD